MGHVSSGESYLEAARRELREELGLEAELSQVRKFLTPRWKYENEIEWEFDAVLEGKVSANVTMAYNAEVADGKWVDFSELLAMVEKRTNLTPDTILGFEEYYESADRR